MLEPHERDPIEFGPSLEVVVSSFVDQPTSPTVGHTTHALPA